MSEKQLNTRITQKIDTTANWGKATTFVPKKGELIIYSDGGGTGVPKFKVGDGTTTVGNLAFSAATHADKATDLDNGFFVQFGNASAVRDTNGTINLSNFYVLTSEADVEKIARMPVIAMSSANPGDGVDLWINTSDNGSGMMSLGTNFSGATTSANGARGLVPTPEAGQQNYFLKGNGQWSTLTTTTTVLLPVSGWSSSSPYTQTITVSDITTNSNVIIDISLAGKSSSAAKAIIEGWGLVGDVQTGTNSITAYCYGDKPTVDIPINVMNIM